MKEIVIDNQMGDATTVAVTHESRREATKLFNVGKHEPKLTENGIPADVLEKLLPGNDIVELEKPVVNGGLFYRFIKRFFDVVSCGCALILLAIPMAVIAVKIKSESEGPVIYAQRRVGKDGRVFNIYKFRSMYTDAESRGAQWAQDEDPRVTPFGKIMRKTRLDEIPQFWNVFKGDMSLIGPRPERPAFCEEFEKRIHGWHYRTMVRPGISGLAQVTGGYDLLPREKVLFDLQYIKTRNIKMDLVIMLKTLGVVSTGDGARWVGLVCLNTAYSCLYKNDKPEFLDLAIASMACQTVEPKDFVIVCDGPLTSELDATLQKWQEVLEKQLTLHRLNKNHGLGFALNVGLSLCKCDIVARMDSDDISRPERCEILLSKMISEGLDLVGGAIEEFDHSAGGMGAVRMPPLTKKDIDTWLKGRNPFNHVSVMFDRHVVEDAGGYEPFPWMEDYWLWARMIARGCRCANVSDVVVDVRTGEGMYARRSNLAYLKSQINFFSELRKLGLVGRAGQAKAVIERTAATVLPTGLVKIAYNKLLRKRKVG